MGCASVVAIAVFAGLSSADSEAVDANEERRARRARISPGRQSCGVVFWRSGNQVWGRRCSCGIDFVACRTGDPNHFRG